METRGHYLRRCAKAKAKAAAKAIAEGRIPGRMGQPPKYTEAERRELRRIKSAKWRAANRERAREITRDSMKRANDAKALSAGRTPGKMGTPVRTPLEVKRANRNERTKKYYHADIEKYRELGAVNARNRRARIKGNGGTHTAADIRALYFEQKGICAMCDLPMGEKDFHVDHWKPLSKGGSNDKSNLKLLHPKCNLMKHDKLPSEFNIRRA